MKKFTVIITALFTAAVMCSCGSVESEKKSSNKSPKNNVVTTAPEEEGSTETFTLPSRETFAKVPDEASQSFDYVIKSVKKSYPVSEKGATRLYGYLGEENINECKCYIFAVYDKQKDVHTEVATVAVTEDSSEIYVYNDELSVYETLEAPDDDDSVVEYNWADNSLSETDSENTDEQVSSFENETSADDIDSQDSVEITETDSLSIAE